MRTERRLFLADGPKAVEGALGVPGCVVEVFATPDAHLQYAALLAGVEVTLVEPRAMAALSDAVSPAGVLAVCRSVTVEPGALLDRGAPAPGPDAAPFLAICADVRDPGNLGTIIRTADAAGASGVLLAGDAVDPHNAKVVRSTVGSLFHLPVAQLADPAQAVARAQASGWTVLAADGAGETDLFAADELLRSGPVAWLLGNEAWGLPADLAAAADHRVRIPIHGRAESLNLATAAALCLYASARANRSVADPDGSTAGPSGTGAR